MPVDAYGPDAWMVTHPGFPRNPQEYVTEHNEFQLSYQFVTFLKRWEIGDYGPSDFHTRNILIAQRRGCFPEPLLNRLGSFTPAGEKVLARAKSYKIQIDRHYESLGLTASQIPQWEECYKMDTIVVAAVIQTKHIVFLKDLYIHSYPDRGVPTQFGTKMPTDVTFTFREYAGLTYAMTSALRNYSQRRKDFEVMVKLGLIGLTMLPRPIDARSRGRAPVGAYLTEGGKRFFEDFQARYDPAVQRMNELRKLMDD